MEEKCQNWSTALRRMPPKQNSFLQTSDAQNARQNAIHMRMPYTSKNAIRMPNSQKKNAIRMAFSVYGILIVWHSVWHFFGIFENLFLFKQYQNGISWKQVYLGSLAVLAPGQLYTFRSTNVQNDQIPKNSSLELVYIIYKYICILHTLGCSLSSEGLQGSPTNLQYLMGFCTTIQPVSPLIYLQKWLPNKKYATTKRSTSVFSVCFLRLSHVYFINPGWWDTYYIILPSFTWCHHP